MAWPTNATDPMQASAAPVYQGPNGQWYLPNGTPLAGTPTNPLSFLPGDTPTTPPPTSSGRDPSVPIDISTIGGGWGRSPDYFPNGLPSDLGGTGEIQPPTSIPPFSGVTYPTFTPPPLPDALSKPFQLPTADDLLREDPGYMARYRLGNQALERGAAAQGSLLSGGQIKAAQQYAQDYASNEYSNFAQRKLAERQQQATDYLTLLYGPSWQQNQGAVNQYGQLYKQYSDLISNNRNAQNDYLDALLRQQQIGATATAQSAPPGQSTSNV